MAVEWITRSRIKVAVWIVLALLSLLLVALNFQKVEVNLIALKFETSLAMLILGVLAIGFLLGWFGRSFGARKKAGK